MLAGLYKEITMKINASIYNKLMAIATEAKDQGMTELSSVIFGSIGPHPSEESEEYSYSQLKRDIHQDMWKMATRLMYYYDVQSVNAEKLDEAIVAWAADLVDDLEVSMGVDTVVKGPTEPILPGENK
jgi:hypothetical protein